VLCSTWSAVNQSSGVGAVGSNIIPPQNYDLSKIKAITIKRLDKFLENSGTDVLTPYYYLCFEWDWLMTNAWSSLWSPKKTLFLEVTQKNTKTGVFIIFRKVCRTKIFQASLGEFGQKFFTPPKFACSYTYKPTWYDLHGRTHNLFLKKSNWMHLTEIN